MLKKTGRLLLVLSALTTFFAVTGCGKKEEEVKTDVTPKADARGNMPEKTGNGKGSGGSAPAQPN